MLIITNSQRFKDNLQRYLKDINSGMKIIITQNEQRYGFTPKLWGDNVFMNKGNFIKQIVKNAHSILPFDNFDNKELKSYLDKVDNGLQLLIMPDSYSYSIIPINEDETRMTYDELIRKVIDENINSVKFILNTDKMEVSYMMGGRVRSVEKMGTWEWMGEPFILEINDKVRAEFKNIKNKEASCLQIDIGKNNLFTFFKTKNGMVAYYLVTTEMSIYEFKKIKSIPLLDKLKIHCGFQKFRPF